MSRKHDDEGVQRALDEGRDPDRLVGRLEPRDADAARGLVAVDRLLREQASAPTPARDLSAGLFELVAAQAYDDGRDMTEAPSFDDDDANVVPLSAARTGRGTAHGRPRGGGGGRPHGRGRRQDPPTGGVVGPMAAEAPVPAPAAAADIVGGVSPNRHRAAAQPRRRPRRRRRTRGSSSGRTRADHCPWSVRRREPRAGGSSRARSPSRSAAEPSGQRTLSRSARCSGGGRPAAAPHLHPQRRRRPRPRCRHRGEAPQCRTGGARSRAGALPPVPRP